MANTTMKTGATIIPTMRYADAVAAIDWLCRAFGFEKHLVVPGRSYSCRDPEGHLWNFGTYNPWQAG